MAELDVLIFLFSDCLEVISTEGLRLDSKVFLLKAVDTNYYLDFSIDERYSVLNKIHITQQIGFWSINNGLKICVRDIWHRRKDSRDIQLNVVSIGRYIRYTISLLLNIKYPGSGLGPNPNFNCFP